MHREERETRQRDLYSELELSDIGGIFAVDRLRREESRPLTSVGMAVESVMVRSRPPVDPDEELGAQRGFFQMPADPLPPPDPARSTSPFRLAEQQRFEEQQAVSQRVQRVSEDVSVPGTMLPGALRNIDRPRGALVGALSGESPADSLRRLREGFQDPETASGRDIGFVRKLSDQDIIGSLSPRDIAGGIADIALDPVDVFFGGLLAVDAAKLAGRGARGAVRAVRETGEELTEQAIRRAEGPLETATRGVLDLPDRGFRPRLQGAAPTIDEDAALRAQLTRDADGAIRRNKHNAELLNDIGRNEAQREFDGIVAAHGGDASAALPDLEAEARRISEALELRDTAAMRARVTGERRRGRDVGGVEDVDLQELDALRARSERFTDLLVAEVRGEPIEASPRVRAAATTGDAERLVHTVGADPDPSFVRSTPTPDAPDPSDVLARITRDRTPGERPDVTLLRRHSGTVSAAEGEVRQIVEAGNARLLTVGVGARRGETVAARAEDVPRFDALYEALHNASRVASGEIVVPDELRPIFDELRQLTDWEQAARLDFDPNQALVDDYFYRGWKAPEGMFTDTGVSGAGRVGAKPAFKKPRADASYAEMREAGFEPLFWNPYEQFRVSRMQGVRYRQQMALIDDLKQLEIAVPHTGGGPIPAGWRTPQIGPAFEGKPFAVLDETTGVQQQMRTRRWIVPDDMANRLENIYGKKPSLNTLHVGARAVDVLAVVDWATFVPKRAKLFGSLFQQADFLTRSYVGGWSGMVDALVAGQPAEAVRRLAVWPQSAYEIMRANLSPSARRSLRAQLSSTKPVLPDRPGVSLKGMVEAGLSTTDVTILPDNLDQIAREAAEGFGPRAKRLLPQIEASMRRGLFEGVYPAAQITDIKNNIAPMIARRFPDATDEALNGMIARAVNLKYSTIPPSQSVLQTRWLRETLRRVFFSIGESEGLLRQSAGAIKGPMAGFWRTHWIGAYLGLMAAANAIHFASTGEMLPLNRYTPIAKDAWGPLPLGYNRDFASPNLPFTGRSAVEVTVDLVGQLDTAFRILDPTSFVTSRVSVPVRALQNQLAGEDFFGRPIDTLGPEGIISRTQQFLNDMFSPIGGGAAVQEIARQTIPGAAQVIPEAEGRLGIAGSVVQATGVNLRAETTPQLLERKAQERFGKPFDELENFERKQLEEEDPQLARELEERRQTSALRGSEGAQRGILADDVREEFRTEQLNDDALLERGEITHRQWRDREKLRSGQIRAALDVVFRDLPDREPETLLQRFGAEIDAATDASNQVDWDRIDAWRGGLSDPENAELDRNLGLNSTATQKEKRQLANNLEVSGFFELRNQAWAEFKTHFPDQLGGLPDDYFKWRDQATEADAAELIANGHDPDQALIDAARGVANYTTVRQFNEFFRLEFRHQWVVDNREVAQQAEVWDYLTPDKVEREFLRGERQPVAAAR